MAPPPDVIVIVDADAVLVMVAPPEVIVTVEIGAVFVTIPPVLTIEVTVT